MTSHRPRRSLRRPPTKQATSMTEQLTAEQPPQDPSRPFTQHDLDRMGCHIPDCEHDHSDLYIHCVHHQGHRLAICYRKVDGVLEIACPQCEVIICRLLIATG